MFTRFLWVPRLLSAPPEFSLLGVGKLLPFFVSLLFFLFYFFILCPGVLMLDGAII